MGFTRASWLILVLGSLGLIDIPVSVNCWYCNHDTELVNGGGDTERCWHCNICGNTNVCDENGEIMDDLLAMHDSSLNPTAQNKNTTRLTPSPSSKICQDCQKNQIMIYKILSDYIPDESDPNYNYYLETANDYKHSLDERYPMCDDCKSTVDNIVAKLLDTLQQKKMGDYQRKQKEVSQKPLSQEEPTGRPHTKTPRKLSSREDWWHMNLWILLHGLVLLFCVHAYFFPQPASERRTVVEDAIDLRMALEEMVVSITTQWHDQSWNSTIFSGPISLLLEISSSPQVCLSMMACFTTEDNGYCEKDYSKGLFPLLVFWLCSYIWMDWHFLGSSSTSVLCQMKRMRLYKDVQCVLYITRIGILFALRYWDTSSASQMMVGGVAVYFSLLAASLFAVKLTPTIPATKNVGRNTQSGPYWLGPWSLETKISQEFLEAIQDKKYKRSNKMLLEEADLYDEAYCEALRMVNKIRVKHGIDPHPIPIKPSWLSKDGGVGDISTGIDDLSFEV